MYDFILRKETAMENANQSEFRRYNRLISEIDGVYHEVAVRQGFSDSAMMILYTLADNDGQCRLPELIKLSAINKQTANSALRKLEKDGIVYLVQDKGKSKRVHLTDKGFSIIHRTVDKVLDIEKKIYSSWTKEEWEMYLKLTERYLTQVREEMAKIK